VRVAHLLKIGAVVQQIVTGPVGKIGEDWSQGEAGALYFIARFLELSLRHAQQRASQIKVLCLQWVKCAYPKGNGPHARMNLSAPIQRLQ
jgi:hypothetical protein